MPGQPTSDAKRRRKAKPSEHGVATPLHTPPGTLRHDPEAPAPIVRMFGFGPDAFEEHAGLDLEMLRRFRGAHATTWLHVAGLGDARVIEALGEAFEIHRLGLEDVLAVGQRPKFEQIGPVTQIIVRMIERSEPLGTQQLSLFLGPGFVLSFEERESSLLPLVEPRLRNPIGLVRRSAPDFLLYTLLDIVVDAYFPVLDHFDDKLEQLEDDLPREPPRETLPRLRRAKHELLALRRALAPTREMLTALLSRECPQIRDDTRTYLRDCQDHCVVLLDLVATYRELASDLVDLQVQLTSQRLNETMKVLTVISTVFIPLTFISSVYGMNFDPRVSAWNMPELRWNYGYPFALLLMAVTTFGMLFYFRRKDWM